MADLVESPEQAELRATLRRLFGGQPACLARPALAGDGPYDAALWATLAGKLGLSGLSLPERYGGSGYTRADRAAALHEMGRCLLPSPFLASVVLAAETLLAAGDEDVLAGVLPGLSAGTTLATVAYREGPGYDCPPVRAARDRLGWRLTGCCSFVLDGCQADLILVPAQTQNGVSLFLVEVAGAPGLSRRPMRTLDPSRPQARLDLSATPGRLVGDPGAGAAAVRQGVAHATIALAAEQVGGAERCLEAAVEYAGTRQQFGRPIGSFQAIKHKCADLLILLESARSAARYAASVSSYPATEDLFAAAALAGAYCSAAFFTVAAENVQIHGGIGFTWEHDAHLYFRRAKASEVMFGTPLEHRAFLGRHLDLSACAGWETRHLDNPPEGDCERS